MQLIVKTALAAILSLGLVSCATQPDPITISSAVTDKYVTPEEYKDHRAQQSLFETPTGNIAFTDHGEGKTVVLLHGVPTSSWMYRKLIGKLTPNMRVITVDLLGYGSSDKPENEDDIYSSVAHARRVEALLAARGVENYTILMHDMGGLVAWEMLRDAPTKVDGLIVLNTIVDQDGFNDPDLNAGFLTRQISRAYSSALTSVAILDKVFGDLGLTGKHSLSENECFGYVRPMREGADGAIYSFFTGLNDEQFARLDEHQTLWPSYDTDVLVMWGEKDKTLTSKQIESLQAGFNIKGENIHVFPDNAHFLTEEIPEVIADKVTKFVQK
ncbi:MAG: alpha/beta fold hydrolase [Litorimonas sp.]